jgi:flagellar biosynthetic protein FlhB
MEERIHPATERQRQRFRERGEVATSRDLTAFGVLFGGVIAMAGLAGPCSAAMVAFASGVLGNLHQISAADLTGPALRTIANAAGPLAAACFVGALVVGFVQTRGNLAKKALQFDPSRINPAKKLTGLLDPKRAAKTLGTSFVKIAAVLAVCVVTLQQELPALLATPHGSLTETVAAGGSLLALVALRALAAILLLGIGDFALNWLQLENKMRMTTKQLKDDLKEEQGDPQIKSARRRRARELSRARSIKEVETADVVIVNPTHFAVALVYRSSMGAPRLVAKGMNRTAQRIREVARHAGVPILSQPPLCRTIYQRVAVGREIPADLYQAVAVVLAQVYRTRRGVA